MIRLGLLLWFALLGQAPSPSTAPPPAENRSLEKSAWFAYVDHDYIFTIEVVRPGVPLLNFVSMTTDDSNLIAKNIWLIIENRKIPCRLLSVEAGKFQQPIVVASLAMHPRSYFGVSLQGDFGNAGELWGATIRIGSEDFKLVPLTQFEFETLALKVNRLNLNSPDFSDDFRVLNLKKMGSRSPARR
jgi:hypothetical protein